MFNTERGLNFSKFMSSKVICHMISLEKDNKSKALEIYVKEEWWFILDIIISNESILLFWIIIQYYTSTCAWINYEIFFKII